MYEIKRKGFTEQAIELIGQELSLSKIDFAQVALNFSLPSKEDDEVVFEAPELGFSLVTNNNDVVLRIYLDPIGEPMPFKQFSGVIFIYETASYFSSGYYKYWLLVKLYGVLGVRFNRSIPLP